MAETASYLPPANVFAFQQSSPHSLREPFSSPPAAPLVIDSSYAPESEDELQLDNDVTQISLEDRRISTVSSVSSFPASVLHHDPHEELRTPSRSPRPQSSRHDSIGSLADVATSPRRRGYAAAFRNPSSVRAMQMKDELGDDSESITPHRRSGSQFSVRSHGSGYSAHTSPAKRFSRSSQSSPLKKSSNVKKEFPLVLLHCTLLPPSSNLLSPHCDKELFGALLPEEYRKRWIALQDRIAMAEVKARGILVPHPQEDYELLEERILESLELEKPRIRSSHYLHRDAAGADSGFESASQTDEDEIDLPHDLKCPDCGKGIDLYRNRKWEIKVYAANGLMRAGAWSAAWREMEKVDIEIGLWLPEDVQQEVNARLEALRASEHDAEHEQQPFEDEYHDPRQREVYGADRHPSQQSGPDSPYRGQGDVPQTAPVHHFTPQDSKVGLLQLVDQGIALLFQDRRNILIISLSILVMYVMTGMNKEATTLVSSPKASGRLPEVATTTVTSTAVWAPTANLLEEIPTSSLEDNVSETAFLAEVSAASIIEEVSSAALPSTAPAAFLDEAIPPVLMDLTSESSDSPEPTSLESVDSLQSSDSGGVALKDQAE